MDQQNSPNNIQSNPQNNPWVSPMNKFVTPEHPHGHPIAITIAVIACLAVIILFTYIYISRQNQKEPETQISNEMQKKAEVVKAITKRTSATLTPEEKATKSAILKSIAR